MTIPAAASFTESRNRYIPKIERPTTLFTSDEYIRKIESSIYTITDLIEWGVEGADFFFAYGIDAPNAKIIARPTSNTTYAVAAGIVPCDEAITTLRRLLSADPANMPHLPFKSEEQCAIFAYLSLGNNQNNIPFSAIVDTEHEQIHIIVNVPGSEEEKAAAFSVYYRAFKSIEDSLVKKDTDQKENTP
jgi:hypothetical protein